MAYSYPLAALGHRRQRVSADKEVLKLSTYEPPTITELGSIADFTSGHGFRGDHDSFFFLGYEIEYGRPPSS